MNPPGVGRKNLAEQSDADLVRRFADGRDQCAFACLVERHSRLVLGACQRMLKNRQDAQDAFQATFLTLARRIIDPCAANEPVTNLT
jgi:DNA-directed RNA polymerase specialized sigma24 family protein